MSAWSLLPAVAVAPSKQKTKNCERGKQNKGGHVLNQWLQTIEGGSLPIGNLCILSLSPVVFWREAWSSWGCGMNENWGHIEGSKWPWKEVFCWHNLRMCVRKSLPLYQYLLMNDKKLLCRAYVIQHRLLQLSCKICWISVIWQI